MFSLKDKVIIVTGANSGIGLAISRGLVAYQANVIRIDKIFTKKLSTFYDIKFDLRNLNQIKKIIFFIEKKFKKIDGLINNAGITFSNNFSEKAFKETMTVNLYAAYNLAKFVCPIMAKNKNGSIINISSLNSKFGFKNNPSYQISKAGIDQLTRSIAVDWGYKNIRCNNIVPGYINSNMTRKTKKLKNNPRITRTVLNRWGEPEDLIGAAIFLMSNASSYVSGSDIVVDGGWSIKGL
jgi:NAD(P)-dependent dehydrogenase (short-subunit alcohol dehydrogenase family)